MLAVFEQEKIISIFMFSFLFLSIFTRVLLGFLYQRMIKEADNMTTTDNKQLKQCKLKFANCFQLNNGVANIPVFVDKFLNKLSIGPISFDTVYHASGQMMLLSAATSGVGICKRIINGSSIGAVLPFYIASFLGIYLYFSISAIIDIKGRKRVLKINLIDYLENHLAARIDITENDMEMLFGKSTYTKNTGKRKNDRKTVDLMPIGSRLSLVESPTTYPAGEISGNLTESIRREVRKAAGANPSGEKSGAFTKDQEKELEELLKEFLAT